MGVFYIFYIVQMVQNRAKHAIYLKHDCPFREEIMINK